MPLWIAECHSHKQPAHVCGQELLTIRVRYAASIVWNLQPAKDELVGALFQAMQIEAMPNSVRQAWHGLPVCLLHHLQLDVCWASHSAERVCPAHPDEHPDEHRLIQGISIAM